MESLPPRYKPILPRFQAPKTQKAAPRLPRSGCRSRSVPTGRERSPCPVPSSDLSPAPVTGVGRFYPSPGRSPGNERWLPQLRRGGRGRWFSAVENCLPLVVLFHRLADDSSQDTPCVGYAALSPNLKSHWSLVTLLALCFVPLGFTEARHHPLSHLCWVAATFSHFGHHILHHF